MKKTPLVAILALVVLVPGEARPYGPRGGARPAGRPGGGGGGGGGGAGSSPPLLRQESSAPVRQSRRTRRVILLRCMPRSSLA